MRSVDRQIRENRLGLRRLGLELETRLGVGVGIGLITGKVKLGKLHFLTLIVTYIVL